MRSGARFYDRATGGFLDPCQGFRDRSRFGADLKETSDGQAPREVRGGQDEDRARWGLPRVEVTG
jgi:hypothetical protein